MIIRDEKYLHCVYRGARVEKCNGSLKTQHKYMVYVFGNQPILENASFYIFQFLVLTILL